MGDSQDRQEAAEGSFLPEDPPSAEMTGGESNDSTVFDPPDDRSIPVGADDSIDLSEVVASLEEPEESAVPEVAGAEAPDHSDGVGEPDIADAEVDPELAALQAELEAEGPELEAVADEPGDDATPSESSSDIEPGIVGGEQEASEDAKDIALPEDSAGIPVWPFVVYFALWVVFAGVLVWQLMQTPAGTPIYDVDVYGISILVGLALTVMGPLLALAVWLALWLSRPGGRKGLFSRSLIIGALTTLAGVAVWLVALGAVDMLRLGRLL
jgi:hypothetical protein